ncbi:MAG: hypothetical protein V1738_05190 [Patescibacteria group bacterium]
MRIAVFGLFSFILLISAPTMAESTGQEPVTNDVWLNDLPDHTIPAEASSPSGAERRNRIWRLFNNNCRRQHSETELEVNMCVAMHRATPLPNRRAALQFLIRAGMINFPDNLMDFMVNGLANQPPDRVLHVTRRIATNTPNGRFLLQLCADENRMTRFLQRLQITLEPVP